FQISAALSAQIDAGGDAQVAPAYVRCVSSSVCGPKLPTGTPALRRLPSPSKGSTTSTFAPCTRACTAPPRTPPRTVSDTWGVGSTSWPPSRGLTTAGGGGAPRV